jgi:hypothetical protein
MMGDRLVMQESLFYEFRLDEFVPSNHMLRAIDRSISIVVGLFFVWQGALPRRRRDFMPFDGRSL